MKEIYTTLETRQGSITAMIFSPKAWANWSAEMQAVLSIAINLYKFVAGWLGCRTKDVVSNSVYLAGGYQSRSGHPEEVSMVVI